MTVLTMLDNPAIRQAVKRISVDEYHRLSDAAVITENTELLHGILIEQMTKSPLHTWIVRQLVDWLRAEIPDGYDVRQEQPMTLEDSEPEPDVAIVRGTPADYVRAHPSAAGVVMEVALATIEVDRQKAFTYAAAEVPEYWLVLPQTRRVEVYTTPAESGYQHHQEFAAPASVSLRDFPDMSIDLDKLFLAVDASAG